MSIKIIDQQDSNLLLTGYILTGKEILQKCKEVNDNISGLIENEFSQLFSELDPKISEWYNTIQSKKIKILDSEKLGELKTIISSLQTYQLPIQKISKVFIDAVLTKIEDVQSAQKELDLTTDSEKAEAYLKRGITYFNQEKYYKAITVCSQAIVLNKDLEKAYLYRKAALDALSPTERTKSLVNIATTTCNFQLCGLTDTDIDDIMNALMDKKDDEIALNLSHNLLTEKSGEKLLIIAKKNPFVTQIEYEAGKTFDNVSQELYRILQENRNWCSMEKGKRLNNEFYVAFREGKNQLQKGDVYEAINYFLKALNRELHNSTGIEALLEACRCQQQTFSRHQKAITVVIPIDNKSLLTGSLDGTLSIGPVENPLSFDWGKNKPQPVTQVIRLNENTIVSGHSNGTLIVWNIAKKTPIHVFEKYHSQGICSLLRQTDDGFISYDGQTIKYWDMKQGETLLGSKKCVKTVNEKSATAVQILSDGNLLLSVKSILKLYDPKNYKMISEIDTKYSSSITAIKQLNDGKFIIGYEDGIVQIYDTNTKKFNMIKSQSESQKWSITTLTILNDKYWLSGSQDGQVKVWDEKNQSLSRFPANSPVTSLCVSSGLVYIGCEDGTLHQWQPSLKVIVPIEDEILLKPFKIDGNLITILKDERGQFDMIARGGFGKVFRGLCQDKPVAIKEATKDDEKAEKCAGWRKLDRILRKKGCRIYLHY